VLHLFQLPQDRLERFTNKVHLPPYQGQGKFDTDASIGTSTTTSLYYRYHVSKMTKSHTKKQATGECLRARGTNTEQRSRTSPLLLPVECKVRHKVCCTLWQDAKYDILYVILCGRPYVDDINLCRTLWQALRRRVHPARMYVTLAREGNFYYYVRMSYRESTKYVQTSPKIPNNYYYVALIVKSSTVIKNLLFHINCSVLYGKLLVLCSLDLSPTI